VPAQSGDGDGAPAQKGGGKAKPKPRGLFDILTDWS